MFESWNYLNCYRCIWYIKCDNQWTQDDCLPSVLHTILLTVTGTDWTLCDLPKQVYDFNTYAINLQQTIMIKLLLQEDNNKSTQTNNNTV